MTETRCEPPEHMRDRDGWHWLNLTNNPDEIWRWDEQCRAWGNATSVRASSIQMASYGYRYLAPATPPDVVARLVEALEAADQQIAYMHDDVSSGTAPGVMSIIRAALAAYREAGR